MNELKEYLIKKLKLHKTCRRLAEEDLIQEHFDSLTKEQLNAQRYAVHSAIIGVIEDLLKKIVVREFEEEMEK